MQRRRCFAFAGLVMLIGATTTPAVAQMDETAVWDPFETVNRATFAFNGTVAMALAPVFATYQETVPDSVRLGIDNVFSNLREPLTVVSSGLQGDFANAGVAGQRFAVNLVLGIGGIYDAATERGLVSRPEDIGSALCSYGVPSGPYLVLPLIGPSTAREALGLVSLYATGVDLAGDEAVAYFATDGVVARLSAPLPQERPADAYVAQRDAYLALRDQICTNAIPANEIKAGPIGVIVRKGEPS